MSIESKNSSVKHGFMFLLISIALVLTIGLVTASFADEIGDVNVDWLGGDIKVDAIEDPKG